MKGGLQIIREFKIYTVGKMSGISYEEQIAWRKHLEECVKLYYDGSNRVTFIHPPLYFNYQEHLHNTEREVLDWEMMQLHDCNIVVVNLDQIDTTIGSHMELGAVQGINRFGDKYIYVVGVGEDSVHPWIKETCTRIENNFTDAAKYIARYLLV